MGTINVNETQSRNAVVAYDTANGIVFTGQITSITRSGTTATVTRPKHGYANGKALTIGGADQSAYNKDITVGDATEDTFTYSVSGSPTTPATGHLFLLDTDSSLVLSRPYMVQISTVTGSTTVQAQQKVHTDAEWVNVGDPVDNAAGPTILIFDNTINFVRLIRAGADDVVAFIQMGR